jgi:hypothetical protein
MDGDSSSDEAPGEAEKSAHDTGSCGRRVDFVDACMISRVGADGWQKPGESTGE